MPNTNLSTKAPIGLPYYQFTFADFDPKKDPNLQNFNQQMRQIYLAIQQLAQAQSAAGSGSTGNYSYAEIPSGTINGMNKNFTLANAPSPALGLLWVWNGLILFSNIGYTLKGNKVTMSVAPKGAIRAWYPF